MRVAIVGAGGLGGYFGGRWSEAGIDVTLIARGAHLDAIRSSGLTIRSPLGDAAGRVPVVEAPSEAGEVDLVVLATKTWQLEDAARSLGSLVGDGTLVVGLQNGVEAARQLAAWLPSDQVLAGTCRIISYIESPGVIRHVGADPTILLGERDGAESPRVRELAAVLDLAPGVTVKASPDIRADLWRKLVFFAPVAGVSSVTDAEFSRMRAVPEVRDMLLAAMQEVVDVGRALGVDLNDDAAHRAMEFVDGLPEQGTSSMQRDFRDGRRTELEALNGAVVRLGAEAGIATPVHAFLRAALLPRELLAREADARNR